MARPIKRSIDYFSFDSDFFDDSKIKYLKSKYGAEGIFLYIYLLTQIYRECGYYIVIDEDRKLLISEFTHLSIEDVQDMIDYMILKNLFKEFEITSSAKILTSERVQKNYMAAVKSRGRQIKVKVNEYIWLIPQEGTADYIQIVKN